MKANELRLAFKEWAVVVDALLHGGQILILRKGGLLEGRGGFQVEHPEFLLFPTLFHQQRDAVIPQAQARYDQLEPNFPPPELLRIEGFARVAAWQRLDSLEMAERLRGQHVWRDEVIAQRFDWGRSKQIHVLAVRVFRLPQPLEMPMLPSYGGCKSWVELGETVSIANAKPVLDDDMFAFRLDRFQKTLGALAIANPESST